MPDQASAVNHSMIEQAVIVTKKTLLEELIERFNSRAQARFYIEHLGGSFDEYEAAHARYALSVESLKRAIPKVLKLHVIERAFLPNYLFSDRDLVIAIGPDGLVVNTAKYLSAQWILAVNPDPQRVEGVLTPFSVEEAGEWVSRAITGRVTLRRVTMAKATLNDGQSLYAFNDLFIGPRSHVSARYRIEYAGQAEDHSSSGLIVSTGAGSTGWLQSIVTGSVCVTAGIIGAQLTPPAPETYRLPWEADELYFTVREPFTSRTSQATIVFGKLGPRQPLVLRSYMPENGVIFSDGIESDYIKFNSGAVATIGLAERKANLIARG
jgi:NAD kinase